MIEKFDNIMNKTIYFFNVTDTYFVSIGIVSVLILLFLAGTSIDFLWVLHSVIYVIFFSILLKRINFYPYFLLFTPLFLFAIFGIINFSLFLAFKLVIINILLFFFTQFLFYTIPFLVMTKDLKVIFSIPFNSLFTICPTTSSAIISIYFSTILSLFLFFQPTPTDFYSSLLFVSMIVATIITKKFVPKFSRNKKTNPTPRKRLVDRIIYLNIDGARLDKFKIAKTPFLDKLKKNGAYFENGARSVYPALTNPAFTSFLTGAHPQTHKILNNNFKSGIKIEALPDVVETSCYGNIHFRDIAKPHWDINVVSVSTYGIKIDDILLSKLENDLLRKKSRLYIADISIVDIFGHAYDSNSKQYLKAFEQLDKKIENFFIFLKKHKLLESTVVFISADHGQSGHDHGYALAKSEIEIPLIIFGEKIKKGVFFDTPSILDLNSTITYLLGVKYTQHSEGNVISEILK